MEWRESSADVLVEGVSAFRVRVSFAVEEYRLFVHVHMAVPPASPFRVPAYLDALDAALKDDFGVLYDVRRREIVEQVRRTCLNSFRAPFSAPPSAPP